MASLGIEKLSFIHIPKTAGQSLEAELRLCFGPERSLRIGTRSDRTNFMRFETEQLAKYDYISGHISVAELVDKGINYPMVSIVREPVKRLYSLQNYLSDNKHADHEGFKLTSLNDFILNMKDAHQTNLQCWHLSGKKTFEAAVEEIERRGILVAPMQSYADFISFMSSVLVSELLVDFKNVTNYRTSLDLIEVDRELMELVIGEDVKLFNWVVNNYKRLKDNFMARLETSVSSKKFV